MRALAAKLKDADIPPSDKTSVESGLTLLEGAKGAIDEQPQRCWTAGFLAPLSTHLTRLAEFSRSSTAERHALDPREDLLYTSLDSLLSLVQRHPNEPRPECAKHTLGELTRIVLGEDSSEALLPTHDVETREIAAQLLSELFKGSAESRNVVREKFIKDVKSKPLLAHPKDRLKSAPSFSVQLNLVDVLVSLGSAGRKHQEEAYGEYLPTTTGGQGKARRELLKAGEAFHTRASELLGRFNATEDTHVTTIQARSWLLLDGQPTDGPGADTAPPLPVHFEPTILCCNVGGSHGPLKLRYASITASELAPLSAAPGGCRPPSSDADQPGS